MDSAYNFVIEATSTESENEHTSAKCFGKVVIERSLLELFESSLAAEVAAGNAPAHLLSHFQDMVS